MSAAGGFHKQFHPAANHPASTTQSGEAGLAHKAATGGLFAQIQLVNQRTVPLNVGFLQVIQKTPALANHQQKAAAAVVILFVDLQMNVIQMVDALG